MNRLIVLALSALLTCLSVTPGLSQDAQTYFCDAGDMGYTIIIDPEGRGTLEISASEMVDPQIAGTYLLDALPPIEGYPMVYGDNRYTFYWQLNDYVLEEKGNDRLACAIVPETETPVTADVDGGDLLDLPGQSLGGKLRSGPGMDYDDIGSLPQGAPLVIIADSGVEMNGYNWFEIALENGIAYQWGGIMCVKGTPIPRIFAQCDAFYGRKVEAQSWGGKVRSGPGTNYAQIGTLAEGTPVTIVQNTGISMNGADWFEITFGDRTGYHWGGIICGVGAEIPGAFETCR